MERWIEKQGKNATKHEIFQLAQRVVDRRLLLFSPKDLRLIGRDEKLDELFNFFFSADGSFASSKTVLLYGVGGVGKTSVALKYAFQRRKWYPGEIFSFDVSSSNALLRSVKENVNRLAQSEQGSSQLPLDAPLKETYEEFYEVIRNRRKRCLLIFDPADKLEELDAIEIQSLNNVHTIICSRSEVWPCSPVEFKRISLECLPPDSAISFLLEKSAIENVDEVLKNEDCEEYKAAKRLVEDVIDCLPIGLYHAALRIKRERLSISGYLAQVQEYKKSVDQILDSTRTWLDHFNLKVVSNEIREMFRERDLTFDFVTIKNMSDDDIAAIEKMLTEKKFKDEGRRFRYGVNLIRTEKNGKLPFLYVWEVDIEELKIQQNEAYSLLLVCASLGPSRIPLYLMKKCMEEIFPDQPNLAYGAVDCLFRIGLLHECDSTSPSGTQQRVNYYTMHSLIQRSIRERRFLNHEYEDLLARMSRCLLHYLPSAESIYECRDLNNSKLWDLMPHVGVICEPIFDFLKQTSLFNSREFDQLLKIDQALAVTLRTSSSLPLCHLAIERTKDDVDENIRIRLDLAMCALERGFAQFSKVQQQVEEVARRLDGKATDSLLYIRYILICAVVLGMKLRKFADCTFPELVRGTVSACGFSKTILELMASHPERVAHAFQFLVDASNSLAEFLARQCGIDVKSFGDVVHLFFNSSMPLSSFMDNVKSVLLKDGVLDVSKERLHGILRSLSQEFPERMLKAWKESLLFHPPGKRNRSKIKYFTNWINYLCEAGKISQSIEVGHALVRLERQFLPENHTFIASTLCQLARCYLQDGNRHEALRFCWRAWQIYSAAGKTGPVNSEEVEYLMAEINCSENPPEAEKQLKKILKKFSGKNCAEGTDLEMNEIAKYTCTVRLGQFYYEQKQFDKAISTVDGISQMAVASVENARHWDVRFLISHAILTEARCMIAQGKHEDAHFLLEGTKDLWTFGFSFFDSGLRRRAELHKELAVCYKALKQKGDWHSSLETAAKCLTLANSTNNWTEAVQVISCFLELIQCWIGDSNCDSQRNIERVEELLASAEEKKGPNANLCEAFDILRDLFEKNFDECEKAKKCSDMREKFTCQIDDSDDAMWQHIAFKDLSPYREREVYSDQRPAPRFEIAVKERSQKTEPPSLVSSVLSRTCEFLKDYLWGKTSIRRQIAVLHGQHGVGKTDIARLYAQESNSLYRNGVYWFNAESYGSLYQSVYNALLDHGKWKPVENFSDNMTALYLSWRGKPKSLIIFENADKMEILNDCLPPEYLDVDVVICSGSDGGPSRVWEDVTIKKTRVEEISEELALDILLAECGVSKATLDELTREKACHFARNCRLPLAIKYAVAQTRDKDVDLKTYMEKIESIRRRFPDKNSTFDQWLDYYKLTDVKGCLAVRGITSLTTLKDMRENFVREIKKAISPLEVQSLLLLQKMLQGKVPSVYLWEFSVVELKAACPASIEMMLFCTLLGTAPIPDYLLKSCLKLSSTQEFDHAASLLVQHGLIQRPKNRHFTLVHPLIRSTIRRRHLCSVRQFVSMLEVLCRAIAKHFPTITDTPNSLSDPKLVELLPHVTVVVRPIFKLRLSEGEFVGFVDRARVAAMTLGLPCAQEFCHESVGMPVTGHLLASRCIDYSYVCLAEENLESAAQFYRLAVESTEPGTVLQCQAGFLLMRIENMQRNGLMRYITTNAQEHYEVNSGMSDAVFGVQLLDALRRDHSRLYAFMSLCNELQKTFDNVFSRREPVDNDVFSTPSQSEALAMSRSNNVGSISYERLLVEESVRISSSIISDCVESEKWQNAVMKRCLKMWNFFLGILRDSVSQQKSVLGRIRYFCDLAKYLKQVKRFNDCIRVCLNLLDFERHHFPKEHPVMATTLHVLGDCYALTENVSKAIECYKEALSCLKDLPGRRDDAVHIRIALAGVSQNLEPEVTEKVLVESLSLLQSGNGDPIKIYLIYVLLGEFYYFRQRYEDACHILMESEEFLLESKALETENLIRIFVLLHFGVRRQIAAAKSVVGLVDSSDETAALFSEVEALTATVERLAENFRPFLTSCNTTKKRMGDLHFCLAACAVAIKDENLCLSSWQKAYEFYSDSKALDNPVVLGALARLAEYKCDFFGSSHMYTTTAPTESVEKLKAVETTGMVDAASILQALDQLTSFFENVVGDYRDVEKFKLVRDAVETKLSEMDLQKAEQLEDEPIGIPLELLSASDWVPQATTTDITSSNQASNDFTIDSLPSNELEYYFSHSTFLANS